MKNHRVIPFLACLALGLMIGLIVSRIFMPERYGLITMLLLFLGGMVTGALLLGAGFQIGQARAQPTSKESGGAMAQAQAPFRFAFALGERHISVRTDPEWGARFRSRWLGKDAAGEQGWQGLWDARWAQAQLPGARVVLVALALAILAQLLIIGQLIVPGLLVYAIAGVVLTVWVWRQKLSLEDVTRAAVIGRRAEVLFVVLIFLVALGARVWQAGTEPRGIDGDELKWTAQVYYDFIAMDKSGDFAGQQKYTPVSFIADKVAFDVWGVDFTSPRIMTAILSVLATLVFYFIARDMFNPFVALVATLFMATSYYDVNTSRQAIVETFTKLPLLLAMWFMMLGVDRQRWFYFLLCGAALYVGVLTYDTFFVVPPALLLYLAFRGVLNWRRWYRWLLYAVLVIAPMLLAYPIVAETVRGRQYTYVKGVSTGISDLATQNSFTPLIENSLRAFRVLFRALQGADYALNWNGPLVNPLVLILFVLGFALVLARFWRRHNLLLILTFVFCFFPAPILSGYTVPRVFYIGLPPIFIFAGVFVAALVTALLSLASARVWVPRLVTAALAVCLAVIIASDGFVLTQQLNTLPDWLKRRALVDTIKSSIQNVPLTLLPVTRSADDFIWGNNGVLKFIAYSATRDSKADKRFRVLTFNELPGALGSLSDKYDSVSIVYDRQLGEAHQIAGATINTLQRCYGDVKKRTGSFFTVYTIDRKALQAPNCYSLTDLSADSPAPGDLVPANRPVTFEWSADSDRPTAYRVQVERRNPKLVWVEGENFPRENGWMFEAKMDHYPGFSGSGYILDDVRSQPTSVQAQIPQAGNYQVWVRSLRGAKEGHRNFLSVGGQTFEFARADGAPLQQWNWEMVGQVDLQAGETGITLSREYGKEGWKPVLIDAVFLSADPEFDPNENDLWTQVLDSGQIESHDTSYVLDKGLAPGAYRWRVQLLDGDKLVDAGGKKGIWSDKVEFQVQ